MQTVGEYLAEAIKFERMADGAIDEKAKAAFKNQADNYRKLAIKRAKELGYPISAPQSRTCQQSRSELLETDDGSTRFSLSTFKRVRTEGTRT